jgi:hypothetical protein
MLIDVFAEGRREHVRTPGKKPRGLLLQDVLVSMSHVLNTTKLPRLSTGKHASFGFVYMPHRFVKFFSGEGRRD